MPLYPPLPSSTNPVIGLPADFRYAESTGSSSTTSTTYQTKLVLTASNLVGSGSYMLSWYVRNSVSNPNKTFQMQITQDGSQIGYYNSRASISDNQIPFTGMAVLRNIVTGSSPVFTMQYAAVDSVTVTVSEARFAIWRAE